MNQYNRPTRCAGGDSFRMFCDPSPPTTSRTLLCPSLFLQRLIHYTMTSFKPLLSPRGKSGPQFWGRKTKVLLFSLVPLFFSFTAAQAQCDITLTPTNIRSATCGGNEGSFSVTVTGITAPYQYSLEKDINGTFVVQESGTLIAGSPTFVFLTAGTYKVTVSKDGCTNSTTVSIPEESLTLTPANIKHPT
ncbi:MAG TPA: SprB repeat-containing protein, partial [Flavisolibacter sp.]